VLGGRFEVGELRASSRACFGVADYLLKPFTEQRVEK
jgi:response regulator of citrate/malate metabolism